MFNANYVSLQPQIAYWICSVR